MTVIDSPCINSYSRCTYCCLFYNNTSGGRAEYCDESVCWSVCLSACMSASYIYETTRPNFTEVSAVAVARSPYTEQKCADIIGEVLVPCADHFQR